ncbi:bifunctional DNA-formamidopyrimidine glycosylase/DNA-(apurinic or apyrimidinic site) lyase [Chloroflexia bacterium SDU3-3]|nr:bifunctional DNA-formamidopyrimidine glycosylase/DNA-(apurinic or apyrimidinic site) lyase [Chloroflexia bacterium SDU3-3]
MPELPEVEHVARGLGAQVCGRTIAHVSKLDWEPMVETPDPTSFRALLEGRRFEAVGRRAKWIVATLDGGWTLALHLRMSGYITVQRGGEPDKHTHLVIDLTDGRQIFFHDTRKFGRARLLDAQGLLALDAAHGIEPLGPAFTPEALGTIVGRRTTKIKPLLLDQSLIAGVGNIYADEALWRAKIHPRRAACTLSAAEVGALHAGIQAALGSGLEHGGSTLRDYRNSYGEAGENQKHFLVYDQQGKACQRCGAQIEKLVVAQRGTHVCPHCQPEPEG